MTMPTLIRDALPEFIGGMGCLVVAYLMSKFAKVPLRWRVGIVLGLFVVIGLGSAFWAFSFLWNALIVCFAIIAFQAVMLWKLRRNLGCMGKKLDSMSKRLAGGLAVVQFQEFMGYKIMGMGLDISTHVSPDNRPMIQIPIPLREKQFTQLVKNNSKPLVFEFLTAGKVYLCVHKSSVYVEQVAVLESKGAVREPVPNLKSVDAEYEVWSVTGDTGEVIEVPFQIMLVAESLKNANLKRPEPKVLAARVEEKSTVT